jgi:colanic acid/amylovoran biosynthesis glycosyltransferase
MKIAYLMNMYPMTSTTFIRSEIEALERRGFHIQRYAVRRWNEKLVDARDEAEARRTKYFLTGNVPGLLGLALLTAVSDPKAVWRGIVGVGDLARGAGGLSFRHVAYLLQAIYLVRQSRRDGIAHIHAHFTTNAAAVAMLSRMMGGPGYSFTAHGPDEFDDAKSLSTGLKLARARFAVAISHFCKAQVMRVSAARDISKITIIHCGLDLRNFDAASGIGPGNQTLVCVGRLCRNKGQALLPAAVARLKSEFPRMKIVLVGDGEARAEIEQAIAHHKVEANFELLGWRSNQEIRNLIQSSRALVLPSFAEGLPVVIMEALALRRPVIATYIAGIPELVDRDCGWIVPAGSIEDLAHAMREALSAGIEDLARMGRVGRARIEKDFDVDLEAEKRLPAASSARSTVSLGGPSYSAIVAPKSE